MSAFALIISLRNTGLLHRNIIDLFDLKLWGAATAAQAAKFRGGAAASLTLTTGVSQAKPPPRWALLAAGLGAVDALGRGLAVDLAPVRVNVLSPGLVKTEVTRSLF